MSDENVIIFDTTLRDGEQSPGASMNTAEKLEVAHALADLNVDVIEAGFPIASPGDYEAVKLIADEIKGPSICGLARCNDKDIDRALDAVKGAERPRVHVFLATSAIHREFKLRMAKEEIIRRAVEGVKRARNGCDDVEFSPEDAGRTEHEFLGQVVEAAIEAGARTINIPDTVGYNTPDEFAEIIRYLKGNVPNIDQAILSVHCHNDLGLAVANSLAAVQQGARQVECTINGIGERAGNASLEELVMALTTRGDRLGTKTNIKTKRLYPTSRLVSNITGMHVQRNKAIVGRNAFAHESGIHQDGMLKERTTYEIMRPEDVGISQTELVLGKHSGRHALRKRIEELGYHLAEAQLDKIFSDFKVLCDKKKEIFDADVEALIEQRIQSGQRAWDLTSLHTSAGTACIPSATITLRRADGQETKLAEFGDGPVDAIFKTLEKITGIRVKLIDYSVRSVSVGKDAQGEVYVEVKHEGRVYRSRAVSTDIVEASAFAYMNALNKIALAKEQALVATEA
ncbi:2-isopropylmalate synthase [Planctomycetes bacterium Pan216]|uniref:2-isopropylmalate synthase n=1 Tax=Kolteria novifilia TaxID=2527975 RepID=A0A518BA54_9BACT|nr:2-isopropylmalate synthase [Planctomycetes bacterium Pan216]